MPAPPCVAVSGPSPAATDGAASAATSTSRMRALRIVPPSSRCPVYARQRRRGPSAVRRSLQREELGVRAAEGEQLLVAAALGDVAVAHDEDEVSHPHR